jgi:hypothetical protein
MIYTQFVKEFLKSNPDLKMSYRDCMKCEEIKCAFKLLAKKEGCADPTKAKPKKKGKDGCTVNVTVNCGPGGIDGPPGSSINPQGVNTQHGAPGAGTKYFPPATNFPQLKPLPPPKAPEVIDLTNYTVSPDDEKKLNEKEKTITIKEENKKLDARQGLANGNASILQNNYVNDNSYPGFNFSGQDFQDAPEEVRDDLKKAAAAADEKPTIPRTLQNNNADVGDAESKPAVQQTPGFQTPAVQQTPGFQTPAVPPPQNQTQRFKQETPPPEDFSKALSRKLEKLRNSQSKANENLKSAEKHFGSLTTELEEKANELRLDKENKQLKQTVSSLTKEVENHLQKLQELAEQKEKADSAAAESNLRANALQGERDTISGLEEEAQRALNKQADEFENERGVFDFNLQQKNQALNELNTEKRNLLDANRKMAAELVSVRELYSEAQDNVQEVTRQLQDAIGDLAKLKRNPDLGFDKERMTADMVHLSNTIGNLRHEKSQLEERMSILGRNYTLLQQAREAADNVNNTKMAEVIAREEFLNEQIDAANAREESLKTQIDAAKEAAKEEKTKADQANERAGEITEWYNENLIKLEAATKEKEQLENQVTELNDALKELGETKPTITADKNDKRRVMAVLKGEAIVKEKILKRQNDEIKRLKAVTKNLNRKVRSEQRQTKAPEESVDPHEKAPDNPSETGVELHNIYADNQDKIETVEDDERKVAKQISRIEKRINNDDRIQKLPDKSGTNSQENKIGKTADQQDVSTTRRRNEDINERNRQAKRQYSQEIQEAYEGNEDELNATAAQFLNILTNQRDKDFEIKANDFLRNYTNFDADVVKSAIKKNITDNINPKWKKKNNSDGTFRYEVTGRSIKTKC